MKSFIEYTNESEDLKANLEKIAAGVEAAFNKEFPHGWIKARVYKSLGENLLGIDFGIIGDHSLLTSKIIRNDPAYHNFLIRDIGGGKFEANNLSGDLSVKPPEGSYLAMGSVKTKFRKTKGDSDRIIKTYKTFFGRLKKIVKDNEADIYGRDKYPDKYFK